MPDVHNSQTCDKTENLHNALLASVPSSLTKVFKMCLNCGKHF